MSTQAERLAEIERLSSELHGTDGVAASLVLERIDEIVDNAASVRGVGSPSEAIASLEIALHALGADEQCRYPEARLIRSVLRFLNGLVCAIMMCEMLASPSFAGVGIILTTWHVGTS